MSDDEFDAKKLGGAVALRRCRLGMTQAELAADAGLSRRAVWALERGVSAPNLNTAVAVARVLGCGVDALLDDASSATLTPALDWREI